MAAFQGLIATAVALGVVAANQERIEVFYEELLEETRRVATAGDMRTVSTMLDIGYVRTGRFPADERFETWLRSAVKENDLRDIRLDAWGMPFRYRVDSDRRGYAFASAGPDTTFGTDDDLGITGP